MGTRPLLTHQQRASNQRPRTSRVAPPLALPASFGTRRPRPVHKGRWSLARQRCGSRWPDCLTDRPPAALGGPRSGARPRACLLLSSPQVPAPRVGTEDAERRREWPGCGLQDCGGPEVNGPLRGLPVKPSGSSAAPGTQTEVQDELSPGPEASLLPSGARFLELRGRAACPHPGTLTPSWG